MSIPQKTDEQRFASNLNVEISNLAKQNPELPLKDALPQATKAATKKTQEEKAAYLTDPLFYRTAEVLLTVIVLAVVLGSIWLLSIGKSGPSDGIIAIGSGAVGALIGLFSTQK
ncbi:MAG: hypothetical protein ACYDEZ_09115 [Methanoregula sp.]